MFYFGVSYLHGSALEPRTGQNYFTYYSTHMTGCHNIHSLLHGLFHRSFLYSYSYLTMKFHQSECCHVVVPYDIACLNLSSFYCLSAHYQLFLLSQRACSTPYFVSARMLNSFFCLSTHLQFFLLSQRAFLTLSSVSARIPNSFFCLSAHSQLFLLSQRACSTHSSVSARTLLGTLFSTVHVIP